MSKDGKNLNQTAALTNLVGQVGCVIGFIALLIIGIAFAAGWFLDNLFGNERRIFTVIFLLGSFPVTLYAMVRVSLWLAARANAETSRLNQQDKDKTTV
jgi:F0F1-type ATP synthase assembly protein I